MTTEYLFVLAFLMILFLIFSIDGFIGTKKLRIFEKGKIKNLKTISVVFILMLVFFGVDFFVGSNFFFTKDQILENLLFLVFVILSLWIGQYFIRVNHSHGKKFKAYFLTSLWLFILVLIQILYLVIYHEKYENFIF